MAHRFDKEEQAWIIDGFQNGIADSPYAGIADIKNLNISSLPGEAALNYSRVAQIPIVSAGTFTQVSSTNVSYGGTPQLQLGSLVSVGSGITGLAAGTYWVSGIPGGTPTQYNLSATYNGSSVSGMSGGGTASFSTPFTAEQFIAKAKEFVSSTQKYRYFMMGILGHLWVSDPNIYGGNWSVVNLTGLGNPTTGMALTQGIVFAFCNASGSYGIYWQFTNELGSSWNLANAFLNTPVGGSQSHYAITTPLNNGAIYYADNSFVGIIQQGSAQQSVGLVNQFTLAAVTSNNTTTVSLTTLLQGDLPVTGLPVTFYPVSGGSLPGYTGSSTGVLTQGTIYYLTSVIPGSFSVATTSGGAAVTINGANFFMTTFYPSSGLWNNTTQLISLPYYEVTTCLEYASSGNSTIGIGTIGRNFYTWDTTTNTVAAPSVVLALPESNIHRVLNVDNIFYIFAGSKGNIYISQGGMLAGALSIPDYIANPYGTNQDPWFIWGDVMFLRGRVWFSIQDQNANNTTGNCGGVWSFLPTQNLALGQDQGVALRLENQNSYGTYNGVCDVLLPSEGQQAKGPQYWTGWSNGYVPGSNPTGIDFSGTSPYSSTQYGLIDADLIPIGTFLDKGTPVNFEYKLSRPLVSGESVQILVRPDLTSAFVPVGIGQLGGVGITITPGMLSDVFATNVQNIQWLQCRILTTSIASGSSFVPFTQLMIRV